MQFNPMYINPAIMAVIISLLTLVLALGSILWKLAGELAAIKSDVRVLSVNLENLYERVTGQRLKSAIARKPQG